MSFYVVLQPDLHELVIDSTTTTPVTSQGLGFTAFRALLGLLDRLKAQHAIPYIPHFIFAKPRCLLDGQQPPPTQEYSDFATQRAVRFFRKVSPCYRASICCLSRTLTERVVMIQVGFRRLGMTDYFCYAVTDVNHPSRNIPPGPSSLPCPCLRAHLSPVETDAGLSSPPPRRPRCTLPCPTDLPDPSPPEPDCRAESSPPTQSTHGRPPDPRLARSDAPAPRCVVRTPRGVRGVAEWRRRREAGAVDGGCEGDDPAGGG